MPVRPRPATKKAKPVARAAKTKAKPASVKTTKPAKAKAAKPKTKPAKVKAKSKTVPKSKPLPPASTIGTNPLDAPVARAAVLAAIFGPLSAKARGKRGR